MKSYIHIIFIAFAFLSCSRHHDVKISSKLSKKDSLALKQDLANLISDSLTTNEVLISNADEISSAYPNHKAEVNVNIAHAFYSKSLFFLAKKYFSRAAAIYLKNGDYELYAEQLTNVGVLNELTGDYPLAIESYLSALKIFEKLDVRVKSSSVYNNLGIVYQQIGENEKALMFYEKSLAISEELEKSYLSASRYNNIASVYEVSNLDSALAYYQKALKIYKNENDLAHFQSVQANIANVYIAQNLFLEADSIITFNLDSSNSELSVSMQNSFLRHKSKLLLKIGDPKNAIKYASRAVGLSRRYGFKEQELKSIQLLIDCYESSGDYKNAFKELMVLVELKNSLSGFEQKNKIEHLRTQFEISKKDDEIKILELKNNLIKKRDNLIWIIVSVVIIALLITIYIFSLQKRHSKLEIKSMQRDISDYVRQLHDFEEELLQKEKSHHELFLEKIKKFKLTEREEQVLLCISKGYKNTEIAEQMYLSINTVKTHIKNIFIKLDVRNRIEATNKTKV